MPKNREPAITVILPAYNGATYLEESVESILSQTVSDFELIAINDGSTDNTFDILQGYSKKDQRVVLIDNPGNIGLIATLNRGLSLSRGRFIARQDADDVSLPHRFEQQLAYFDRNPDVGLVGSTMDAVDEAGRRLEIYRFPETDLEIRFRLLFNCSFCHTSVMVRKELLDRYGLAFDHQFKYAEDYELWVRLLSHTKAYNFPDPLVKYRVVNSGVCKSFSAEQDQVAHHISSRQLKAYGEAFDLSWEAKCMMLDIYRRFLWGEPEHYSEEEKPLVPLLAALVKRFIVLHNCREPRLMRFKKVLEKDALHQGIWGRVKTAVKKFF